MERELKSLSKSELIEIIYEQKKRELELTEQLEQAKELLELREIKIEKAGSIAEAALSVNGVFEAAQKAAEDYLRQIRASYGNVEARCLEMIEKTKTICRQREEESNKKISDAWAVFEQRVQEFARQHPEFMNTSQSGASGQKKE